MTLLFKPMHSEISPAACLILARSLVPQAEAWTVFGLLIAILLFLDLKVFHRHAHEVKFREAIAWSVFWIGLGVLFVVPVYWFYNHFYHHPELYDPHLASSRPIQALGYTSGRDAALAYLTGFLVEKSLSVDNLFVFYLMFSYFGVPAMYQHRVLFWGILGAIVMRLLFILAGVSLIHRFHWVLYLFGLFLLITGVRMAFKHDEEVHPERNPVLRLVRRILPITPDYRNAHFFVRQDGQLLATPMFVVLVAVETTDVVFAVDSIPAILGITTDAFIVYTSNVFAILGLRALYFALAGLIRTFHMLHYGLAAILVFIGVKMILETGHYYPELPLPSYDVPTTVSLAVIATVLSLSVAGSLIFPRRPSAPPANEPESQARK